MASKFRNRSAAGQILVAELMRYRDLPEAIVMALPRGGVPVGQEVAEVLHLPLDICLVRKLGVPSHPELAMGAIARGGSPVLNRDVIADYAIPRPAIEAVAMQEWRELERRNRVYRGDRPLPDVRGKTVLVVDDGIATGATMRAALSALRSQGAARLVVAVPVASAETCAQLRAEADEVVCPLMPARFWAVGNWYESFPQVSDREVCEILARHGVRASESAEGQGNPRTPT